MVLCDVPTGFVALIVFHYLPMFGISLAFFRYQPSKIANPLEFTGLANFQKLFSRPQFWSSFTNTLEISIIKLLLNTFMAVIIRCCSTKWSPRR